MTAMTSDYPVQLEIDPAAPQNRLKVFFRPILTIPHWIALVFLGIAAFVVWLVASVAIVVTGRYPAGLLRFSIGVARWVCARVCLWGHARSGSGLPLRCRRLSDGQVPAVSRWASVPTIPFV